MIQRALLARTLLTEPNLLLLDEPLGQLDLVARRALAEKIRGYVKERQAGAVIVSHSVEEVVALADKVLILSARPSTVARRFSRVAAEGCELIDSERAFEQLSSAALEVLR